MRITIPLKLQSLANMRWHWRKMDKEKKHQKTVVKMFLHGCDLPSLPVVVTLTRIGKRRLDGDNLQIAGKYVRDQIAAAFGVDDGDERYTWVYEQRIGKEYAVEIEIVERRVAA